MSNGSNFTTRLRAAVAAGEVHARQLGSPLVTPGHLMFGLLSDPNSAASTVAKSLKVRLQEVQAEVDSALQEAARRAQTGAAPSGQVPLSGSAKAALQEMSEIAADMRADAAGTEHLFLALLKDEASMPARLLLQEGRTYEMFAREVAKISGGASGKPPEPQLAGAPAMLPAPRPAGGTPAAETALAHFTTDLTAKAEEGALDPLIGRHHEVEEMVEILGRRRKNNPILVGAHGVGKTAIVEGLARLAVDGAIPEAVGKRRIHELDLTRIVAGTKYRGQLEERIQALVREAEAAGVILFIDEAHTLIGAGSAEGGLDIANVLKGRLARGELRVIAATTEREYTRYFESDPALARRFSPVTVRELTRDDALKVLRSTIDLYEDHHGVRFEDQAVEACVDLSIRFLHERYLPDKAIDLLDRAGSRVGLRRSGRPEHLQEMDARLKDLQEEKARAVQQKEFEVAADIRDQERDVRSEITKLEEAWRESLKTNHPGVTREEVASVVARMTGVPVTTVTRDERKALLGLEEALSSRVIGQEPAVSELSRAVRRSRSGVRSPDRPQGTFLFTGPTGVGKTELARQLATQVFGDPSCFIRIDMSEYRESFSTSKILGSPPGYVGHDVGGGLANLIRRRPYSVVLFDEVEKAHPDVHNLLLQIMDEGRLTDAKGRYLDFRNTVIILTSNLGGRALKKNASGLGFVFEEDRAGRLEAAVHEEVQRAFSPEFINRLDATVHFQPLDSEALGKITGLLLDEMVDRLGNSGIHLTYDAEVVQILARLGHQPEFGARPLRRTLQREVEDRVSELVLSIEEGEELHAHLSLEGESIAVSVADPSRQPASVEV